MTHERDPGQVLTELINEVFRANGAFLAAGNHLTSAAGLTAAKLQVLGFIRRGPVTVASLARSRGLSRQSVQEAANRLIADGLVEREANPDDGRAPLLRITAEGWRAFRATEPARDAWANQTARSVNVADIETTITVLRTLRDTISDGRPSRGQSERTIARQTPTVRP